MGLPPRLALVVGAEGPGLTNAALAAVDRTVRIPMAAGVDSVNVATAAAIALSRARSVGSTHRASFLEARSAIRRSRKRRSVSFGRHASAAP